MPGPLPNPSQSIAPLSPKVSPIDNSPPSVPLPALAPTSALAIAATAMTGGSISNKDVIKLPAPVPDDPFVPQSQNTLAAVPSIDPVAGPSNHPTMLGIPIEPPLDPAASIELDKGKRSADGGDGPPPKCAHDTRTHAKA
ncbi:hypothetical protein Hypma_002024 [Hypsizygus marmoreus]|uniref:Uncharacterized protein n=1 Tax=Hypsizygus marmoreus TaxID=39966 RepID=A0A369J791_HYPMA|nr:hypothetical protein Hypma_002024 [Hypsizygus marmoreus]